jgi:uncharacterized damage-inducible protein DinB
MTLRQLVSHLVDAVGWVGATLDLDVLEMDPGTYKPYVAPSRADALSTFDRNVIAAAGRMKGQSDEHLLKHWTMRSGGKTVFTLPRIAVLRTFIINHQIHHRGQLDVYLRLKDVSLPQIYGPTADEPGMFPRN